MRLCRSTSRRALLLPVFLGLHLPSALAEDAGKTVGPPDVYVQIAAIRNDIESIRFVTGQRKNTQAEMRVDDVHPREVYFQALTLFRKANRLCFEHVRERASEPAPPNRIIESRDVLLVVEAVHKRLELVKAKLGIETRTVVPTREASKTPADVYRSIVQANRQLNLLLDRRFTPSDVYEQITRGIALASRLLEQFPQAETIPDAPSFEVGKRPADVYRRLVECFDQIRRIAEVSDVQVLKFKPNENQIKQAEPSDVYDIASLLISELVYLHSRTAANAPRKAYYPGRKFPSHVYQRAGLLQRQLRELETRVKSRPNWLSRNTDAQ